MARELIIIMPLVLSIASSALADSCPAGHYPLPDVGCKKCPSLAHVSLQKKLWRLFKVRYPECFVQSSTAPTGVIPTSPALSTPTRVVKPQPSPTGVRAPAHAASDGTAASDNASHSLKTAMICLVVLLAFVSLTVLYRFRKRVKAKLSSLMKGQSKGLAQVPTDSGPSNLNNMQDELQTMVPGHEADSGAQNQTDVEPRLTSNPANVHRFDASV